MDRKTKRIMILIAFGVVLFVGLTNLNVVWSAVGWAISMLLPLVAGLLIAFILNVPVKGFEKLINRMFRKCKKRPNERAVDIISIVLTVICISLIIALVVTTVIPELVSSVKNIYSLIEKRWPIWIDYISHSEFDTSGLTNWMKSIDVDKIIGTATSSMGSVLNSIIGITKSSISIITTSLFSIVIAFYVLIDKKSLAKKTKKYIYAYINKKHADRIYRVSDIISATYSKFLSGQCVEAVILGVFMFVSFSIFRLPYAGLVAVLWGVCAFIPYIGAFVSCVTGALLTLIYDPSKVILCVIVYSVVQFIENQFIYPHVVGNSVGLSALWTLLAALIGGKLFGLVGILFFIPLTAVIITLVEESTDKRIAKKGQPEDIDTPPEAEDCL